MGKKKSPEISFPKYQDQSPTSFSLNGQTAGLNKDTNTYGINYDPQTAADNQAMEQIRRDLLQSFGLNSGSTTEDPYTKAFLDESLRTTQPRLENSLIQRGLGGSSVYQGALSDLFSKLGTQATLNNQQYKTNALSNLSNYYFNPRDSVSSGLLNLANNRDVTNNAAALDLYKTLLPLTAKVNMPKSNNAGLIGSIAGGGLGFLVGGPAGLSIGSQLGGSLGGSFDPGSGGSGVNLGGLSSLFPSGTSGAGAGAGAASYSNNYAPYNPYSFMNSPLTFKGY